MSHQVFENERRHRLGSIAADVADDRASGRSSIEAFADEATVSRPRRPREDPSGRRSLTGLEFRRRRSI
jgi:hypothetical protein